LKELGEERRIILKRLLRNRVVSCGLDSSGTVYGPRRGYSKHGNEHPVFIKDGEYLD
jgi:hypothetical protein